MKPAQRFPVYFKLSRTPSGRLTIGTGDAGIAKTEFPTQEEQQDFARALPFKCRPRAHEILGQDRIIRTVTVDRDGGVR